MTARPARERLAMIEASKPWCNVRRTTWTSEDYPTKLTFQNELADWVNRLEKGPELERPAEKCTDRSRPDKGCSCERPKSYLTPTVMQSRLPRLQPVRTLP